MEMDKILTSWRSESFGRCRGRSRQHRSSLQRGTNRRHVLHKGPGTQIPALIAEDTARGNMRRVPGWAIEWRKKRRSWGA